MTPTLAARASFASATFLPQGTTDADTSHTCKETHNDEPVAMPYTAATATEEPIVNGSLMLTLSPHTPKPKQTFQSPDLSFKNFDRSDTRWCWLPGAWRAH
ncbi:hypothetical protein [Corynebacterium mustelae]|uniref:hypothetical protein n=1 Tax=Corynebacterium mustelae TaxID=571915 RepID=UPI0006412AC7|nr:hypothetical protein [Corynebacterium mustelae]